MPIWKLKCVKATSQPSKHPSIHLPPAYSQQGHGGDKKTVIFGMQNKTGSFQSSMRPSALTISTRALRTALVPSQMKASPPLTDHQGLWAANTLINTSPPPSTNKTTSPRLICISSLLDTASVCVCYRPLISDILTAPLFTLTWKAMVRNPN